MPRSRPKTVTVDKNKRDELAKRLFFDQLDQLDTLSENENESKRGDHSRGEDYENAIPVSEGSSKQEVIGQGASGAVGLLGSAILRGDLNVRNTSDRGPSLETGLSGATEAPTVCRSKGSPSVAFTSEKGRLSVNKRPNTTTGRPVSERMGPAERPSASKRRRTDTFRAVPEEQQIFKGLLFFFFPNSDKSPLRRVRIQRAQEYGALWVRNWGEDVTHVIVDKDLAYKDILTFLKLDSFPPHVAIVDECYPSECIKFRSVLDASYSRFRVIGAPSENKELTAPAGHSRNLPPIEGKANLPIPQHSKNERDTASALPQPVSESPKEQEEEISHKGGAATKRDALDDIIDEAKAARDLPLDPLDVAEDNDSDSDSGSDNQKSNKPVRTDGEVIDWQQKFTCMQKHDGTSNSKNQNARTIEVLQEMLDYYTRTSDHWRVIAYRKAISALRRHPKRVVSKIQALSIPGIGPRLADKIEEIVWTNRLRRLENTNCTPEDRSLQLFLGVYGAGVAQATKWVTQGYRTLEDLRTKATLTTNQRIGVDHYHDFTQRIPRQEVAMHGEIVRQAVQKVEPEMQVIISGSYRRGAADCGDIDVLITKPDATIEDIRSIMTDSVVPELFQQGFLRASLAVTSQRDGSKWHGASALPGSDVWRRIDLLYVPGSQIGAALIYFTGNDIFNRSMRLLASKKGMCLNQRGLYTDVLRGRQRVKLARGRIIEGRDEKRIFEILGVPWRPPEHRVC